MKFKYKNFGVMGLAAMMGFMAGGTGYSAAQTPVMAQDQGGAYDSIRPTATITSFNAAGYEATPMPKPVRKPWKLSIPVKKSHLSKAITMVPTGTAAPKPGNSQ